MVIAILNGFNPKRPPPIYSYLMGKYSEDLLIDKFYVPKTMMVLAFLVMIFVQIKIERYDKKLTSNLAKEDNDQLKSLAAQIGLCTRQRRRTIRRHASRLRSTRRTGSSPVCEKLQVGA